jgi:phosphate transport system substrate-binding protein
MKSSMFHSKLAIAAVAIASITSANAAAPTLDEKLPEYKTVSGVSGTLNSIGSDTLNNLMQLWGEGFKALYPNVNVQIQGAGSSTAPPALIEGTAQLAPMSREMKGEEIDAFEAKYGYKPTAIGVSVDALAVFANKDNPIKGMTMQEVDAVFSSTYRAGGNNITQWSELGLSDWPGRAISLYGRNSASGTYGFFKEISLQGGDFKSSLKEQPGSSAVVQGVASELTGLGYSGIGYGTADVRAVPLGTKKGEYFEANYDNCISGDYPLARFLYVYVNNDPTKEMDILTREFMKFVVSKNGQQIVLNAGYFPLIASQAEEFVSKLK